MFESQFVEIWQTPGKSVLYHKRYTLHHTSTNSNIKCETAAPPAHAANGATWHPPHREIELATAHILHIVQHGDMKGA